MLDLYESLTYLNSFFLGLYLNTVLLCLKHHSMTQSHKGRALEIFSDCTVQSQNWNPSLALLFNCCLLLLTYSRKLISLKITTNCKSVALI